MTTDFDFYAEEDFVEGILEIIDFPCCFLFPLRFFIPADWNKIFLYAKLP